MLINAIQQIVPGGFWVKPLPFADDFRDLSSVIPLDSEPDPSLEESKEVTDRIVKKLTFRVILQLSLIIKSPQIF